MIFRATKQHQTDACIFTATNFAQAAICSCFSRFHPIVYFTNEPWIVGIVGMFVFNC